MTEEPEIAKRGFTWSVSHEYATAAPGSGWQAMLAVMKFGNEGGRKAHQIEHPVDPERIAAHAAYCERWEAVIQEGRELGFLEEEYGGGYYVPGLYPRKETVWDETEEEWAARMVELEKRGKLPPALGGTDD